MKKLLLLRLSYQTQITLSCERLVMAGISRTEVVRKSRAFRTAPIAARHRLLTCEKNDAFFLRFLVSYSFFFYHTH